MQEQMFADYYENFLLEATIGKTPSEQSASIKTLTDLLEESSIAIDELMQIHHQAIASLLTQKQIQECDLSTIGDVFADVINSKPILKLLLSPSKFISDSATYEDPEKLYLNERRYRALFEQSHDGIFIIGLDGM